MERGRRCHAARAHAAARTAGRVRAPRAVGAPAPPARHREPAGCPGGPIALVKNGDPITIDAEKRQINLDLTAGELKRRSQSWKAPRPRYTRGVLAKYASTVASASLGAVTDLNLPLQASLKDSH